MSQLVTFQGKIAATGTAQELPANALQNNTLTIAAKSGNTAAIVIINSSTASTATDGTGAGYILAAGTSVSIDITNTNALWVAGTANDVYSGIGS
jgi:hypothetical protein